MKVTYKFYIAFGIILLFPLWIHAQIGVKYKIKLKRTKTITSFTIQKSKIKSSYTKIPKFESKNLPLFCKMEFNLEKKTHFPVRFRLGTVDIVDQLEGKQR